MSESVVVSNLRKVYRGGVVAVDGLSFAVKRGEIYGLVGPNGSGKTTTLRIIATLLKPTSGDVLVEGYSVVRQPMAVRSMIGYLPEEAGAYRDLTGYDFIEFMLSIRFKGRELEERIDEAISISDLGEFIEEPVKKYSKGMKRILALSVALAVHPRVLVLDEPTSGLDVEKSMFVRELIKRYREREGITVILSSHNMLEVENLCDRVGIIYKGKLIAEGEVQRLKSAYSASNLEEVFLRAVKHHGV
ncbi:ABC transporter ATP-binding protein [Thermogladius sp.]|uniref:ABC transporter ATP-binding protein n=1 Tax=Thermogladius sp. TaxID=2023064 RepID=UPI003D0A7FCD